MSISAPSDISSLQSDIDCLLNQSSGIGTNVTAMLRVRVAHN